MKDNVDLAVASLLNYNLPNYKLREKKNKKHDADISANPLLEINRNDHTPSTLKLQDEGYNGTWKVN